MLAASSDHVIFERHEVLTLGGKPHTVFTPLQNAWLKIVAMLTTQQTITRQAWTSLCACRLASGVHSGLGLNSTCPHEDLPVASGIAALLARFLPRVSQYRDTRDFPVRGPSYMGAPSVWHRVYSSLGVPGAAAQHLGRRRGHVAE
jgi:deoxyribodipyrimidine photo-lyase